MQMVQKQQVELVGGNNMAPALWLAKKCVLNVSPVQVLQGQQL